MNARGFTLLELTITASLLSVVSLLGFMAVRASTASAALADASSGVQADVRGVMQAITRELQYSAKDGDDSLEPVLEEVAITENPVAGAPVEIAFQTPADDTGRVWSRRIRYRFVNEDTNGNGRFDAGEDLDGDHVLTRRILRIQDRNGDGDTLDAGEQAPVGGSNNLQNVQFARNGDEITVTLTASRQVGVRRGNPVTARVSGRVYLLN